LTQPTWEVAGGTFRRAASAARVDRHGKRSSREWGFGTRAGRTGTGRTAPASTRRSCHRRCGTPRRSARSAAGRRAPAGRRPNAPPAGRRPGWRVAGLGRSPWRGPGERRNSPRLPGDRDSDRRIRLRPGTCQAMSSASRPRRSAASPTATPWPWRSSASGRSTTRSALTRPSPTAPHVTPISTAREGTPYLTFTDVTTLPMASWKSSMSRASGSSSGHRGGERLGLACRLQHDRWCPDRPT
jgi:hypothetical protein